MASRMVRTATAKGRIFRGRSEKRRHFDELYDASFSPVYAYCYRRSQTHEDTEDAVADTFLVAWRRLDVVLAADYPTAWLYAVARRVLANQRKLSRRNENTAERANALALPVRLDSPADDALHALELEKVFTAMTQLSDADQELLVLAALDQLSHAEIAVVLDIPVKTTKSRLYRARQRLQDRLVQTESPNRSPIAPEGSTPNV